MLTVSLYNIVIEKKAGLYAEEEMVYNKFEVDVDVFVTSSSAKELAFVDYTVIRKTVGIAFDRPHKLLEHFIRDIYAKLKEQFPESEKVKIVIRKLNPPMEGEVGYAQVSYEG